MTVIAIDGPSGSGKSTLARRLAHHCGLAYLDTGSMYRAVTQWCLHRKVNLEDQEAVLATARTMPVEYVTDPESFRVLLAGVDVTEELHSGAISSVVSAVAVNLGVRAFLKDEQRRIIAEELAGGRSGGQGIVAEGRDITTVVAPDADVRMLLIASEDARLARRAQERHGRTDADAVAATRDEVIRRDQQDSTVSRFMEASDGVVTLDNSGLSADETFALGVEIVEDVLGAGEAGR